MTDNGFSQFKKELDTLRRADYAYSRKLLAFAKRNKCSANAEDSVLASCFTILEIERFYPSNYNFKKLRKNSAPHSNIRPLEAWEQYEKSLSEALDLDNLKLKTRQTFRNGEVTVNFFELPNIEILDSKVNTLDFDSESSTMVVVEDSESDNNIVIVRPDIEHVSDVIEEVDELEAVEAESEPFAYDNVVGNVSYAKESENDAHVEGGSVNISLHKDYVAPEEPLDPIFAEAAERARKAEEAAKQAEEAAKKDQTIKSKGFDLKTKKYEAPQELTVDNSINDEAIAAIIASGDAELIKTVENTIDVDTELSIKGKEYEAPAGSAIDNSINVSRIVINPRTVQPKKKRRFGKKAKAEDYSGVSSENEEAKEYSPSGSVSLLSALEKESAVEAKIEEKPVAQTVDERTLAEANEYSVISETDLKLKNKGYNAPAELIIDNSLPSASVIDESKTDAIVVETVEHAIESSTEIKIKNKKYEAPEELVVDNSIIAEDETEAPKKRGMFGRKKQEKAPKLQPVVFLPPKPIEYDIEAPSEGFVYKPKNNVVKDIIVTDEIINIVKPVEKPDISPEINTDTIPEESDIYIDKIIESETEQSNDIDIDFSELSAELSKERNETEAPVYVRGKHAKQEEPAEENSEEEKEDYSEKVKANSMSNSGFDVTAIIKDIKLIDN